MVAESIGCTDLRGGTLHPERYPLHAVPQVILHRSMVKHKELAIPVSIAESKDCNVGGGSNEGLLSQCCSLCGLTLDGVMHHECPAVKLLHDAQAIEKARQDATARRKRRHRKEYGIGWTVDRIPRNLYHASKLKCDFLAQHGLCCLVFDEQSRKVRIAESVKSAACVNLEYLSLALQVRLRAGREPLFSLEPLSKPEDPRRTMQAKRFEPEWLMGTSLGEVMFQADYHLKELSFGEYEQPVVGMKSAFDWAETEGMGKEWTARAWYVVNKAKVCMTQDDVLVPLVEMGVEAREQEFGESGVMDLPLTRPDHPMVKYAAAFTHNFDLIAERKSVVNHLRDVAKASVLAKFLVEAKVELDDVWFNLVDWSTVKETAATCCLRIPQLWKDRCHSEVQAEGATSIGGAEEGVGMNLVSLYGGVQFDLGRFNVAPASRLPSFVVPPEEAAVPTLFAPTRRALLAPGVSLDLIQSGTEGAKRAADRARVAAVRPDGVDLNLDQFELSEPTKVDDPGKLSILTGSAFWSSIDNQGVSVRGDERARATLLKEVFNPNVSDRRSEGDLFVCPDCSEEYMCKLYRLVREEAEVRRRRKEHFLSKEFMMRNTSHMFPSSWSFSEDTSQVFNCSRVVRSHDQKDLPALKDAALVFDKETEDGLRFRIYRHGNLEVRTTQEYNGPEVTGAAFTTQECDSNQVQIRRSVKVTVSSVSPAAAVTPLEPNPSCKVAPASERKARLAKLIHSSVELSADREVVLAAVEQDGLALQWAVKELRADRDIVNVALQNNGGALEFADERLRADCDIVLAAVQHDVSALEYASEELRQDSDVASVALQSSGFSYQAVGPSLRRNRDFILTAVQRDSSAFKFASDELRSDRAFQLAAVQKNALVLKELPKTLHADHDFMLQVVRNNAFALKFASDDLRSDREIVHAALEQDIRAAEYASTAVREECLEVVRQLRHRRTEGQEEPQACDGEKLKTGVQTTSVAAETDDAGKSNAEGVPLAEEEEVWVVIGDGALGGVVVRKGEDLRSDVTLRLARGAKVKTLSRVGERLQFQKLSGEGPEIGWVSIVNKGKEMLRRA